MDLKEFSKILEVAYNKDYPNYEFNISTNNIDRVDGKFLSFNFQVDISEKGIHVRSFDLGQVMVKDTPISTEFILSFFKAPNFQKFENFLINRYE